MIDKKTSRIRRARKARAKLRQLRIHRLCVHRTPRHIYAQIIDPAGSTVVAAASTVEKKLNGVSTGNMEAARAVGALVAERAKSVSITSVAFDRSGFKYHGRVKALAEAARESGLKF